MKISAARLAAFEILSRIETDRAYSSVLLPLFEQDLPAVDRGLCHELVLGVLRRQIYLDKTIELYSGKKKLDTAVRIALRLGAYQLIFLDKVPAYSAINESVNLVQKARKTSAKGFVNAILRKIAAAPPVLEYADDLERLSVDTSHPKWLVEKWVSAFGYDDAERLAVSNNEVPRTAFRRTRRGRPAESMTGYAKSAYVEGCYLTDAIDGGLRAASDAGEIYFQDEASQLVAQAAANKLGNTFLDVCAAPGGKTGQIAAAVERPEDVLLVAGDLHTARVGILRATCEKQGVDFADFLQYDAAAALPFADGSFETVLVDAPCSGTGTIRHNPEIRYFLAPSDFAGLASKQLAILNRASKVVKPGGYLIYSTCSLEVEENEIVCKAFLEESTGFQRIEPGVPERFVTSDGYARTLPYRDGMDGFFIEVLRRNMDA
jgi:16S rRNA (cytosine967-C5)-methyltransferase